jgi:hypothetical protein
MLLNPKYALEYETVINLKGRCRGVCFYDASIENNNKVSTQKMCCSVDKYIANKRYKNL